MATATLIARTIEPRSIYDARLGEEQIAARQKPGRLHHCLVETGLKAEMGKACTHPYRLVMNRVLPPSSGVAGPIAADAELAADVPALAVERDHPRARRDVDLVIADHEPGSGTCDAGLPDRAPVARGQQVGGAVDDRGDVDDAVDDGRGRGAEALRLLASAPALRRSARLSRSGAAQRPTWLPLRWSPCPMGGKTTSATALSRNTVASATEAS